MTDFEEPKRFWSKVRVGEPDECWEWRACQDPRGYGRFGIHYKMRLAHRVAWFLTYGPIPKGLCVCHKCDNPSCCNPYHLFLGTQADNLADAARKGRTYKRIFQVDILKIRNLYATGDWSMREIADEFGVSPASVYQIIRRKGYWRKDDTSQS